ncbi:APC family permease [Leptolyngbya sp. 7M]|uniref:APC family permease n=1 Tax=Leptolyngbya sp. 7M TaxID=2812896 RepID=UPI001B8B85C1|nr:amino acid permease [Leptolyngbya sp. 7M]QYO65898.1 amino acid permease [Leptolyngbya sp. 7M]
MATNPETTYKLVRGLGLLAAISVIIGNVIGTGVFFKARVMTCNVGTGGWVVAAWIAAGLLALAGSLTYAELTAMKPKASAEYVLLRDGYGRASSFLYGWMQLFIAKTGSMAALAVAFAIALNSYLGNTLNYAIISIPVGGSILELTTIQIIAIMAIIIFTTLNSASVAVSGQIATALTFVKIALVVLVGLGAFLFVSGGTFGNFGLDAAGAQCLDVAESQRYGHANYSFFAGFAAAMLGALWGYDGWNQLTFVAGEVKDPNRNIPLAIIGSTILIIILYVFVHVAYFYVLDPGAIAAVDKDVAVANVIVERFFAGDVASLLTGAAVALFSVGLMISSLGSLHTSVLAAARVPYAMARDRLFFSRFERLSINGVPIASLILQGAWAILLILSDSLWRLYNTDNALFDTLTNYVVFGSFIFYGLITSTVFLFRKRYPDAPRPYRTFGYPVVPVIFLLVTAWLLLQTLYDDTINSLIGIGLILLGLPFYYYFQSKTPEGFVSPEDETEDE